MRSIALEKKLVTVHADLNPDRRLHASGGQARSLYAELIKNMATRTKPEGGALAGVVEKFIGQAKTEAEEILSEARRIGDAQRERVREETEEDRQRRLEETRRQIDQATVQALGQIREEVGKLSLLAAEKITRKSLNDADQKRLIDEALAEIDFSELEGSRS